MGLTTPPTNLDPAANGSGQQTLFLALANEPITYLQADGTVGPGLATDWKYVGDGNTTFQFTLRDDAAFSDGTPVTADSVKAWFDYFAAAGGPFSATLKIASTEVNDEHTVTLHLAEPNPVVPYLLSQVYNIGDVADVSDPENLATQTAGAGPYMIDPAGTVTNDTYVYVPNPHYYDPSKIHYQKITMKVISQPSTMLAAVQSGQIDVALGDYSTVGQAAQSGLDVIHHDAGWIGLIFLDRVGQLTPALGNEKVRQAMNYAINRDAIVQGLLGNEYSSPTSQPPTLDGNVEEEDGHYAYDPERAKSLLKEAGFADGFSFDAVSMTYTGVLGDPVMQAISSDLEKVGITMNISSAGTQADYGSQLFSTEYPVTGFVQTPVLPMYMFYKFYLNPVDSMNQHGWSDEQLNSLWAENAIAADTADTAQNMSTICVEEACNLPVATFQGLWYSNGTTDGIDFSAATGFPYPSEWTPAE